MVLFIRGRKSAINQSLGLQMRTQTLVVMCFITILRFCFKVFPLLSSIDVQEHVCRTAASRVVAASGSALTTFGSIASMIGNLDKSCKCSIQSFGTG